MLHAPLAGPSSLAQPLPSQWATSIWAGSPSFSANVPAAHISVGERANSVLKFPKCALNAEPGTPVQPPPFQRHILISCPSPSTAHTSVGDSIATPSIALG